MFKTHKKDLGVTGADLPEIAVSNTVVSRHTGVTHVYLQQRHRGIEVWNAIINVNVAANGTVLSAGGNSSRTSPAPPQVRVPARAASRPPRRPLAT